MRLPGVYPPDTWANGELSLPINHAYAQDYPIIQYADDTLMIMRADADQIVLQQILHGSS